MKTTTIAVPKEAREELARVAAELQLKRGRHVDLGEAVHFLLHERKRRADLLEKACSPLPGAKDALRMLQKERRLDERRAKRKYGL